MPAGKQRYPYNGRRMGMEDGMLAELDVMVFIKSHDDLDRTAERVFGALSSEYQTATMDDSADTYYRANGLGFRAALYPNAGDTLDPEFERFGYGLEITSQFWCVELDTMDLERPLSEYFARQIAFELDLETGTEVLVETTEESEVYEIRVFRRNPQYRLDQAPTTPKVFIVESRQVEEPFDEDWEEGDLDEGKPEEAPGEGPLER